MKILVTAQLLLILGTSSSFGQNAKSRVKYQPQIQNTLKAQMAGCQVGSTTTELALNNVRTRIYTNGLLWNTDQDGTGYEIPKGSGKSSIYAGALWISGVDIYGAQKQCAMRYLGGRNYWPGPLITEGNGQTTTSEEVCYEYDRHFEITRYQVETFRDWCNSSNEDKTRNFPNYFVPKALYEWPAHGNASQGYDFYLAPFWDNNDDGIYNPADGDYPFYDLDNVLPCGPNQDQRQAYLKGDATIWGIYNDAGNIHAMPGGESIGLEIRAQAFQFSSNDELNNMSFYNFELINRSTYTLYDTHIGLFVDGEIGYGFDDNVGCDVGKGLGYFYNGKEIDGEGEDWAYGANPPAIGFDLFEGPYKDPNGMDDCSSYDLDNNLICNECILNGNINGLNFGDGVIDNERLGMNYFMSYSYFGNIGPQPEDLDIYQLLRGIWRDNEHLRYYGNGHPAGGGTGPKTNFMFPGTSDPCGWGQGGVPMPEWTDLDSKYGPGDRRYVLSTGPFTMEPGEVNDLTYGVVWARSYDGGLFASVNKMLLADEKAQALFDNCFRVMDGPDAPELTIREEDQKLTFHIWNKATSNNYLESYKQKDPSIVCPSSSEECDKIYRFQGYQIWQLRNQDITINDIRLSNTDQARLVFQCDLRDGIKEIINFEWNHSLHGNIPQMMVDGEDEGIKHSFVVQKDMFAKGDGPLVNFKDYYYVAIAYAYNNYQSYNQNDPNALEGQKKPYLAGRSAANGSIIVYSGVPHKILPEEHGVMNSVSYGSSPKIRQIEGFGNGANILDLDTASHDQIMAGPPWKIDELVYENGKGPISVQVVDPLNIKPDDYVVKFDSVDYFNGYGYINGEIFEGSWLIYNSNHDTVFSDQMISVENDQLILKWGLSINITLQKTPFEKEAINSGFLEATIQFDNPGEPWLWFVKDDDRSGARNWIRSGNQKNDYPGDPNAVYESVLEGTWAPYKQTFYGANGVSNSYARELININKQRLSSVDIYITSDRSRWTRSPVVETTDDEVLSIGNVDKFNLRDAQSIDKYGNPAPLGSGLDSTNTEAANYISETGMGWFPGYAIDVTTGERLNIVYGESSWLTGDNGADMMWNPSIREGSKLYEAMDGLTDEGVYFGGKHFIYIMGHNNTNQRYNETDFPAYDAGKYFMEIMQNKVKYRVRDLFVNTMWTAIPILDERFLDEEALFADPYSFIKNDVKIRLRVVDSYRVGVNDYATSDSLALNGNKPMYQFTTKDLGTLREFEQSPKEALEWIRVVPNPYYGEGYSSSSPSSEEIIKVTNLPQLCTISIYSLNGNLVKRIAKDSDKTFVDWDMRNDHGVNIAPGAYIIHINAPGIGEKTLKWFGIFQ